MQGTAGARRLASGAALIVALALALVLLLVPATAFLLPSSPLPPAAEVAARAARRAVGAAPTGVLRWAASGGDDVGPQAAPKGFGKKAAAPVAAPAAPGPGAAAEEEGAAVGPTAQQEGKVRRREEDGGDDDEGLAGGRVTLPALIRSHRYRSPCPFDDNRPSLDPSSAIHPQPQPRQPSPEDVARLGARQKMAYWEVQVGAVLLRVGAWAGWMWLCELRRLCPTTQVDGTSDSDSQPSCIPYFFSLHT